MQETWVRSLGEKDPLERVMQPTPVFLPGEFHGQRNLLGCSPWDNKESDTTERLTLSLSVWGKEMERGKGSLHSAFLVYNSGFHLWVITTFTLHYSH